MVYYFNSTVSDPPSTIYVGKDKFESMLSFSPCPLHSRLLRRERLTRAPTIDEELIKYGWEEDVWYQR